MKLTRRYRARFCIARPPQGVTQRKVHAVLRSFLLLFLCLTVLLPQQQTQRPTPPETDYILKPAHVFDGESGQLHDNWAVLVHGDKIAGVGPAGSITPAAGAKVIDLPGLTLMPGLIEAHSHVLLHPYTETVW